MTEAAALYQCTNPACSLGSVSEPGHFTAGATAQLINVLTGKPVESLVEGEDFGEGICPSCGTKGELAGMHEYHPDNGTSATDEATLADAEDGA